jgi:hypothetical protein
MSIDEMEVIDGSADLLLVIGTMLHTNGAAKLVKSLSRRVHSSGGAVIFINGGFLLASTWSSYIDLHLETDIEEWAEDSVSKVSSVSRSVAFGSGTRSSFFRHTDCPLFRSSSRGKFNGSFRSHLFFLFSSLFLLALYSIVGLTQPEGFNSGRYSAQFLDDRTF